MTIPFEATAVHAVFVGDSLPAHDEVFDAATKVAHGLRDLHRHVTATRTVEQADAAVAELLDALQREVK